MESRAGRKRTTILAGGIDRQALTWFNVPMNKTVIIVKIDRQKKSLWLSTGHRIAFSAARRAGIDVEAAKEGQVV